MDNETNLSIENGKVMVEENGVKFEAYSPSLGNRGPDLVFFTVEQIEKMLKTEREKAIAENQHLIDIGKLVLEKFVSGNTIPVSRCVITADELELLSTNESKENEVKK